MRMARPRLAQLRHHSCASAQWDSSPSGLLTCHVGGGVSGRQGGCVVNLVPLPRQLGFRAIADFVRGSGQAFEGSRLY